VEVPIWPMHTERLLLRPFKEGDLAAPHEMQSDEEVVRYLYHDARSLDDVRAALARKIACAAVAGEGDGLSAAAVLRGTGEDGPKRADASADGSRVDALQKPRLIDSAFHEAETRRLLVSVSAASRHALEAGDTERLVQLIDEFDEILFDSLQNRRIRALIGNLRDHVTRIGHLSEQPPGRLAASVAEHERITQAITDGDPDAGGPHDARAHPERAGSAVGTLGSGLTRARSRSAPARQMKTAPSALAADVLQ
jgi:FCD domain